MPSRSRACLRRVTSAWWCLLFAGLVAIGSWQAHAAGEELERTAEQVLRTVYPRYTLFPAARFGEDVRYALSIAGNRHSPVAVAGDFDGNGQTDYAALAMAEDQVIVFVILMADGPGNYRSAFELQVGKGVGYVMLNPVAAGSVIALPDSVQHDEGSVRLQRPAVELVYVGKAMVVYYWDPETGGISEMATGD